MYVWETSVIKQGQVPRTDNPHAPALCNPDGEHNNVCGSRLGNSIVQQCLC